MRISTQLVFDRGINAISSQQKVLVALQTQVSSGQRINKPSDDPLAMSTALAAQDGVAQNTQFNRNVTNLRNQLNEVDTAMGSASEIMQSIKESLVSANNSTLSTSDKKILGSDLQAKMQQLMGIANRKSNSGAYMFAGNKETTAPFNAAPADAPIGTPAHDDPDTYYRYQGDTAVRKVAISTSRSLDVGVTANDMFSDGTTTGNNYFSALQKVINELKSGTSASVQSMINSQSSTIDDTFDHFQLARTKIGGRLRELDTVESLNTSASDELQRIATEAVSVDYAKVISDLSQTQFALEASQKTFAQVSKLSLFNML
ncbi:MAG: flagellar hook-associated protein FlgL [Burkholderiaceae bacterium]|jgi:flagellar hook-associated protein 3 FlgL